MYRRRVTSYSLQLLSQSTFRSYSRCFYSSSFLLSSADSSFDAPSPANLNRLTSRFPENQIVWLGGLPNNTTRDSITNALQSIGGIADIEIVSNRFTGQPRGYGFVAFDSAEKATSAIERGALDIEGTQVRVQNQRKREDMTLGGRKVFLGNLSYKTTKESLSSELQKFGEIDDINLPLNPESGRSRGFAFVVFKNKEDAEKSVSQREVEIDGRVVHCEPAVQMARKRPNEGFDGGRGGGYGGGRGGGSSYGEGGARRGGFNRDNNNFDGGRGGGGYGGSRGGGSSYGEGGGRRGGFNRDNDNEGGRGGYGGRRGGRRDRDDFDEIKEY